MHELALAQSIVESATRAAREAGARAVREVRLRVGALAGVDASALRFGFEVASRDTLLAGATLEVTPVPLRVFCARCAAVVLPASGCGLRCPACGLLAREVRAGRELEIESLEVED